MMINENDTFNGEQTTAYTKDGTSMMHRKSAGLMGEIGKTDFKNTIVNSGSFEMQQAFEFAKTGGQMPPRAPKS